MTNQILDHILIYKDFDTIFRCSWIIEFQDT